MQTRTTLQPRRKCHSRLFSRSPVAIAVAAALGLHLSAPVIAGPSGGVVVEGQGTISTPNGSTTVIDQGSQRLDVNWNSFNVGANESVRFNQPSSSAVAVNHILDQSASQIFGRIDANGKVVLVNPNGLLIGRTAQLNVGSLVASSLDAIDFDASRGGYRFSTSRNETGAVINEGRINAAAGGSVTLLGGHVTNSGSIVADFGTVNLAAGRAATIDLAGDGLLRLEVGADLVANSSGATSAVENSGLIQSNGGRVLLTAGAMENVFTNLVNNTGIVRANRIDNTGGTIQLVGPEGIVISSGTVDASAGDAVSTGGSVDLFGERVGLLGNAVVDVSGAAGGGSARIGGDYQGSNPDVINATRTVVSADSTINADAGTQGDGGRIIVWSDGSTRYDGILSARGGSLSGNGGFAEVSGKNSLGFNGTASLTAAHGNWGRLLLDPKTITIVSGNNSTTALDNTLGVYDYTDDAGADVSIGNHKIEDLLTSVQLDLRATDSITQLAGADIDVRGVPAAYGHLLALEAQNGAVTLNGHIYLNNGEFDAFGSTFVMGPGSSIDTGSGYVYLSARNGITVSSINTTGGATLISSNGKILNDGDPNTRITVGGQLAISGAQGIGASGVNGALDIDANYVDGGVSVSGGTYLSELNNVLLRNLNGAGGSVTVTSLGGDITVRSVSAQNDVSLNALSGRILDDQMGFGLRAVTGDVNLHAYSGIGTITDYAQRQGAPVRINAANRFSANVDNIAGQINLLLPTTQLQQTAGSIRLGNGAFGMGGQILLQANGPLDTSLWDSHAIDVSLNPQASVTLSAGMDGTPDSQLILNHDGLFTGRPGELVLHGSDIRDNDGSPDTLTLFAGKLRFDASAPSNDKTLYTTIDQLDAYMGVAHGLIVHQTGNLTLGNVYITPGLLSAVNIDAGFGMILDDANDSTLVSTNNLTLKGSLLGDSSVSELDVSGGNMWLTSGSHINIVSSGPAVINSAVAGAEFNLRTLDGAIIAYGIDANGIDLRTNGSIPRELRVNGLLDSHAMNVTLMAGGGVGGNVTAYGSNPLVRGNQLNVSGATIGVQGGQALKTDVDRIMASTYTGDLNIVEANDLSYLVASSAGDVNVRTTSGALTANMVGGNNVSLRTSGAGKDLTIAGAVIADVSHGGSATLVADAGALVNGGGYVAGNVVTLSGNSIGSASGRLSTVANTIDANSSAGGLYLREANDVTVDTAVASGGDVDIITTDGVLTVTSASGNNISLASNGTLRNLSVGDLTVTPGGGIVLSATDQLVRTTSAPITAGSLKATARSIGTNLASFETNAGSLDLTSTDGSLYVLNDGSDAVLKASATGGSVNVTTLNNSLDVTSAAGTNGVSLTTGGANRYLSINGAVESGSGDVTLVSAGAVRGSASNSIAGANVSISGESVGTSASRLNTNTGALNATASAGDIYVQNAGNLQLTAAATGGSVNVANDGGTLALTSVTGTGATLGASGANAALTIDGTLNVAGGTATLTSTGAITQSVSAGDIVADTLNATGASLGTSSGALRTRVANLNTTSTNGGTFVIDADDVSLTASATGGGVSVETTNGVLTAGAVSSTGMGSGVTLKSGGLGTALNLNGAITTSGDVTLEAGTYPNRGALVAGSGASVTGAGLTVVASSIGTSGAPLMTNVTSLDAQTTSGDLYVREADDLNLTSIVAAGDVDIGTLNGALRVNNVLGSNVKLTALGAGSNLTLQGGVNSAFGAATLTADGAIVANNGAFVAGDSLTASATAIGSATQRLATSVNALNTTSSNGGTFITNGLGAVLNATVTDGALDVEATQGPLTATVSRSGAGGGVRLVANGDHNNLTVNGPISGGTGDVALQATGAGSNVSLGGSVTTTGNVTISAGTTMDRGAFSFANGSTIAGDAVSIAAKSVGSGARVLLTRANSVDARASAGGVYVREADGLRLNANATSVVNVETLNGALIADGVSGSQVTLTSGGVGSGIAINGLVTTPGLATLTAGGAITAGSFGQVNANALVANASSVGTAAQRLNTEVDFIDATTTNGGMFITEMDGVALTASATGGAVDVLSVAGPLSARSVAGDGVTLASLGSGVDLGIDGNVDGRAGDVSLTANGGIAAFGGALVSGNTLSVGGVSVGSATARLKTKVNTLVAQSVGGGIYVTEADDLKLTGNALGGGALDVQTTNGSLSADMVNGNGVTLTANGAGKALNINGMVNSLGGDISLLATGANGTIVIAGSIVTPGNVSMVAGSSSARGAIVAQANSGVMANALTMQGSAIGSATNALYTAVTSIDATATTGDIFVTEADDVNLTAAAQGGRIDVTSLTGALTVTRASSGVGVKLTTSGDGEGITLNGLVDGGLAGVGLFAGSESSRGAIVAGNGASVRGNVLTATGASIGSSTSRLKTNIDWLNGTATNGGIYVDELDGLANVNATADGGTVGDIEILTATGDLGIRNVNASDTVLLAAGGNIKNAVSGSAGVTARTAELRSGAADAAAGQVGTTGDALSLTLAKGDTLRIYSNMAPAITRTAGVKGTVSQFDVPNADAVRVGFGQFSGKNSTSLDATPTGPTMPSDDTLLRAILNEPSTTQRVFGEDWTPVDPDAHLLDVDRVPLCLPPDQRRDRTNDSGC